VKAYVNNWLFFICTKKWWTR